MAKKIKEVVVEPTDDGAELLGAEVSTDKKLIGYHPVTGEAIYE